MHFSSSQSNTVRQYVPLATFIVAWGEPALDALRAFVASNKGVAVHAFKPLQGLLDWGFMKNIIGVLAQPRCNPSVLAAAVSKLVKQMWMTWHMTHPALTTEVHPDRSMLSIFTNIIT